MLLESSIKNVIC